MQTWLTRSGYWLVGLGGVLFGGIKVLIELTVNGRAPFSTQFSSPIHWVGEGLQMIALLLLALGVLGISLRQPKASVLRTVGLLLAFVGTQVDIGLLWSNTFLLSPLAQIVPTTVDGLLTHPSVLVSVGVLGTNALFGIGWMVFAGVQLWVGDGPRVAWALVIVAMLAFLPLPLFGGALFAVALAWVGWSARTPLAQKQG
jgi:hypothetical protein